MGGYHDGIVPLGHAVDFDFLVVGIVVDRFDGFAVAVDEGDGGVGTFDGDGDVAVGEVGVDVHMLVA